MNHLILLNKIESQFEKISLYCKNSGLSKKSNKRATVFLFCFYQRSFLK